MGSSCSPSPTATAVSLYFHHPSHTGHLRSTLFHQTRLILRWIQHWQPPGFTTEPPELSFGGPAAISSCHLPAEFPPNDPTAFPPDGPTTFLPDGPAELPHGM